MAAPTSPSRLWWPDPARGRGDAAPPGARRTQRGRTGNGDPGGPATGQRRREPGDPRLRPARVPHRPRADRSRGDGGGAGAGRGRVPLQPRHARCRRHHGRLRGRSPHERAEPPDRRRARGRAGGWTRRRALPCRRRVPPPRRGAARLGRRRVRAPARPHRQAGGLADRRGGREARRVDGRVASGGGGGRRACRTRSRPRFGSGVREYVRRCRASPTGSVSKAGSRPRSTWCAVSVCSRTSRCSTYPARPPASTTTTSPSATPVSTRSPIATSSCCTSKQPTRRVTSRTWSEKVAALEAWDRDIIGPLLEALPEFGAHRVLLLPDHATPLRLGTHTSEPVPYLFYDSSVPVEGRPYTEPATAGLAPVPAHGLMGRMTTGARAIA